LQSWFWVQAIEPLFFWQSSNQHYFALSPCSTSAQILITLESCCSKAGESRCLKRSLGFMMCTFCGSGNRPENKFCGMCGVRMERRQQERRTSRTENLRCSACNHVNEPGHKFCGMCGAKIERRVKERRGSGMPAYALAGENPGRAVALANAQLPTPEMSSASAGWS